MKKNLWGYMTVEASLIMATTLLIYVFLIRCILWSYDRCLLEENVATLLLSISDTWVSEDFTQNQEVKFEKVKYIWVQEKPFYYKKNGFTWEVKGGAEDSKFEDLEVVYKMRNLVPQDMLRWKRKVLKEGEEGN